jgi:hypothetical protein
MVISLSEIVLDFHEHVGIDEDALPLLYECQQSDHEHEQERRSSRRPGLPGAMLHRRRCSRRRWRRHCGKRETDGYEEPPRMKRGLSALFFTSSDERDAQPGEAV